jgi:hypothetical protein
MTAAPDLSPNVRRPVDGAATMGLVVEDVHCGACIAGLRGEAGAALQSPSLRRHVSV